MDTTALNLALDQLAAAAAETDRHAVGVQSGAAKALSNATQTRHDVVDVLAALADVRAALDAGDGAILARIDRDEKERAADTRAARRFATTTTIAAVGVTAGAVGAIVSIFGG